MQYTKHQIDNRNLFYVIETINAVTFFPTFSIYAPLYESFFV